MSALLSRDPTISSDSPHSRACAPVPECQPCEAGTRETSSVRMHSQAMDGREHRLPWHVRSPLTGASIRDSSARQAEERARATLRERVSCSFTDGYLGLGLLPLKGGVYSSSCSRAAEIASRSLASPSDPGATLPASELNLANISSSTYFSGWRTPSDSRERTANRRSSDRVELSSPASDCGSGGVETNARSRLRLGALRRDEIEPSFTTKDPGVCSRHSLTTPRLRKAGKSATIAARTAETPPGLWLPRPVISRTSLVPATCRSRNHASAR